MVAVMVAVMVGVIITCAKRYTTRSGYTRRVHNGGTRSHSVLHNCTQKARAMIYRSKTIFVYDRSRHPRLKCNHISADKFPLRINTFEVLRFPRVDS